MFAAYIVQHWDTTTSRPPASNTYNFVGSATQLSFDEGAYVVINTWAAIFYNYRSKFHRANHVENSAQDPKGLCAIMQPYNEHPMPVFSTNAESTVPFMQQSGK